MYHTLLYTLLILFFTAVTLAREEHDRRVPSRFEVARSEPDDKSTEPGSRAVYWIPTMCDSLAERGYTCYSCEQAMHCMLGNVGLLALCYGRRPHCNNGVCSDLPSQRCRQQYEQQHLNATQAHAAQAQAAQAQAAQAQAAQAQAAQAQAAQAQAAQAQAAQAQAAQAQAAQAQAAQAQAAQAQVAQAAQAQVAQEHAGAANEGKLNKT